MQIKLLQVIRERTFTPVGSHERLRAGIEAGTMDARQLMAEYCGLLTSEKVDDKAN